MEGWRFERKELALWCIGRMRIRCLKRTKIRVGKEAVNRICEWQCRSHIMTGRHVYIPVVSAGGTISSSVDSENRNREA
jgi:hypothetical protein